MVIELNSSSFSSEVLESKGTTIVDFWAPWCGPCRSQAPIMEQFATEVNGKIKVCKLDTDSNGDIAAKYGIMSIPTILVFKDGTLSSRAVGVQPLANLRKLCE